MNELYRELKQYVHNELGITKEDIRDMIKQCVKEEVSAVLSDRTSYNKFLGNQINAYLESNNKDYKEPKYTYFKPKCLDQIVYDTVVEEVSKTVKERVQITLSSIEE